MPKPNNNYTDEERELFDVAGVNISNDENNSQPSETPEAPSETPVINPDNSPNENPDNINQDLSTAETGNPENESTEPVNNEPAPEQTTPLILGKFKSVDELASAYSNLEALSGKQSTTISELRNQISETLPASGQSPVSHKAITQNDVFSDVTDEQLQNYMISNPREFIRLLKQDVINSSVNSIEQKNSVDSYIDKFFGENSDISYYADEFRRLCSEVGNPEYALEIIRGKKAGNVSELLNDESFVSDNLKNGKFNGLLSNDSIAPMLSENVKQKIIDEYVANLKKSKSNANLMNDNSAAASKVPPKSYNDVYDMYDDSLSYLKELENERK